MKKKQLYLWHRWLSMICLLPVIMWCLSGLMHPLMAHFFKITPAQRFLKQQPFAPDSSVVRLSELSLSDALIQNIHLVRIGGDPYYQIQMDGDWEYYSLKDGHYLKNGDQIYAEQLARYFLGDSTSAIFSIDQTDQYTGQYKIINRLLPVFKVRFDRQDRADVYVHTGSSRLGTINDKWRKAYLWIFSMFHNWDFLGEKSDFKRVVVLGFSSLVFITGILGLVIYFKSRNGTIKINNATARMKPRARHRKWAVAISVILLMFSFSGAFHALQKFAPYNLNGLAPAQLALTQEQIKAEPMDVLKMIDKPIRQLSILSLANELYYRVEPLDRATEAHYLGVSDLKSVEHGDMLYAKERAEQIAGASPQLLEKPQTIRKFERTYGFINKRLPVVKVAFDTPDHLTCFIEPSSGIPGAVIRDKNRIEILSFLFLHKYNLFNFLGKGVRDTIMSLASLAVVVIAFSGLWILIKK